MTHADDLISRAFPEAESVTWSAGDSLNMSDPVWLRVVWSFNPLVAHTVTLPREWDEDDFRQHGLTHEDLDAFPEGILIDKMREYRSTRLVARLLEIVREKG